MFADSSTIAYRVITNASFLLPDGELHEEDADYFCFHTRHVIDAKFKYFV